MPQGQWALAVLLLTLAGHGGGAAASNCSITPCVNDGLCESGNCTCLSGYAGDLCERAELDSVSGDWLFFMDMYTTANTPPGRGTLLEPFEDTPLLTEARAICPSDYVGPFLL